MPDEYCLDDYPEHDWSDAGVCTRCGALADWDLGDGSEHLYPPVEENFWDDRTWHG